MKSLVLYGDSLLARCNKIKEQELSATLGGDYEIYNCATGGWDTGDLIQKTPLIARLAPDIVVLSIGTNDASPWKQIPLDSYKGNLKQVLLQLDSARIIMFPLPPINENLRPANKKMSNSLMKQYHDVAIEVCYELSIEYLPTWEIFMELQRQGKAYHVEDGVHFNDFGYTELFKAIKDILR